MPRTTAKRFASCMAGMCLLQVLLCGISFGASVSIRVQKQDGRPLPGAVLTLEPESQRLPPPAPVNAVVDQRNLSFDPDILIIQVGSTVAFPNGDAVSHQVYSFSSARRFQLPLYRGKPYPPVSFDQPGLVTLGCNIHDNMLAYVIVTAAPFFGRSDDRGEWVVTNLPNGPYRLKVWHPLLNESAASLERLIEVEGEQRANALVKLSRALRPAPLASRPHSWDY